MLRCAVSKVAPVALRQGAAAPVRQAVASRVACAPAAQAGGALRFFSNKETPENVAKPQGETEPASAPENDLNTPHPPPKSSYAFGKQDSKYYITKEGEVKLKPWEEDGVVLAEVVDSLEWTLSSPPPVHQFDEPPIIVEIDETGWVGEPIFDEHGVPFHWVDRNHDDKGDFHSKPVPREKAA